MFNDVYFNDVYLQMSTTPIQRAAFGWDFKPFGHHQLADKLRGCRLGLCRLHAYAHKAICVVDRLPGGASIHQHLHGVVAAFVGSPHQRSATIFAVLRVHVVAEFDQQPDRFLVGVFRPFKRHPFQPGNAGGDHQWGNTYGCCKCGIGAVFKQQLHEFEIARLCSTQKRRSTVFIQPLVREDRAGLGAGCHAEVGIGTGGQQQLDVFEMVHVKLAGWIVAAFNIAIVGSDIERVPAAFVGYVGIGSLFEQVFAELIETVLGGGKQLALAKLADFVYVGTSVYQRLHRSRIIFTYGKVQRSKPATAHLLTGLLLVVVGLALAGLFFHELAQ